MMNYLNYFANFLPKLFFICWIVGRTILLTPRATVPDNNEKLLSNKQVAKVGHIIISLTTQNPQTLALVSCSIIKAASRWQWFDVI